MNVATWVLQPEGAEARARVWAALIELGGERFRDRLGSIVSRETLRRWLVGKQKATSATWQKVGEVFEAEAPDKLGDLQTVVRDVAEIEPGSKLQLVLETVGEPVTPARGGRRSREQRLDPEAFRQELFIPVHKFVWLYPEEERVVDTPAFQRLRLLSQLGMSSIAFPGATHRRFEHVLGSVAVANRILKALRHNMQRPDDAGLLDDPRWVYVTAELLSEDEERFIRLAALIHDIGHLPFGHTIEDELGRLGKHDERERLQLVLDKARWFGVDSTILTESDEEYSRSLRDVIDSEYEKFLPAPVRAACPAITPSDLVQLIILKRGSTDDEINNGLPLKPSKDARSRVPSVNAADVKNIEASGFRLQVAQDIVGNTICADLLDYLHRDWFHIGKFRDFDERIFQYMEVRKQREETGKDVFVIRLTKKEGFRPDGVSAILDLLECRHQLAEAVLFHKTKIKATAMLERCLSLLIGDGTEGRAKFEDWLLNHAEEALLPALIAADNHLVPEKSVEIRRVGQRIAYKLAARDLYSALDVIPFVDLRSVADDVSNRYHSDPEAPRHRSDDLHHLEFDFGLPLGTLAMYCPRLKMHHKIAEVRLLVEGKIKTFNAYDFENDELSGGHLAAQGVRARSLWRVGFYWDEGAARRLVASSETLKAQGSSVNGQNKFEEVFAQYRELLQQVVRNVVLIGDNSRTAVEIVKDYSRQLQNLACFDAIEAGRNRWQGIYKDLPRLAALGDRGSPQKYALGFRTLATES